MDGDDSITNVATPDFISIEGASGPVDPPLSFHSISGFITRYDVLSNGNNNDMSIFEVMPFGLKNAGATYQRAATNLFHDMMHKDVERLCLALVWATRILKHYVIEYSIRLVSRLDPLRYLFDRLVLTKFDIQYVTQKSVKDSIVADHLASLLVSDDTQNDDDFPNEQFVSVASIAGWCLDFDGVVNQSRFGIGILLISPQTVGDPYGFQLGYTTDLGFDELRNIHLPRAENQFVDALATLASMIEIPTGMTMQPLLIETIFALAYFCLIGNIEDQRCPECQMHRDLIHVPPSKLHALTSPWTFLVWGVDVIGKVSLKSSSGHEYILVAIDYFTKWVEVASYASLTAAKVAKFIRSHIICQYGIPHGLILDREVHFRGEVDTLVQEYGIQHHRSFAYRPQTNGAVEATNKNIKRILR
uniref:Integrase catalytic domain-containing protein n=2 Tax=Vitis vinifera TaxID=29760 RepID=A5BVR9_VITVI|nr:hypothetical protein VITISV_010600 [Vitis vinifera]